MNDFLAAADEWFVIYAMVPLLPGFSTVTMYCIGHVLECYLKAVVMQQTGMTVDDLMRQYGHRIENLWRQCKTDPDFMPGYEIRDSVLNAYPFNGASLRQLTNRDFQSYVHNQELYFLCTTRWEHLKYSGALPGSIQPRSMVYYHPNPYWIQFIRDLRHYLGHPSRERLDWIRYVIDTGDLSYNALNAVQYLRRLYS